MAIKKKRCRENNKGGMITSRFPHSSPAAFGLTRPCEIHADPRPEAWISGAVRLSGLCGVLAALILGQGRLMGRTEFTLIALAIDISRVIEAPIEELFLFD